MFRQPLSLRQVRFQSTFTRVFLAACLLLSGCIPKAPRIFRVGVLSGLNYISAIADGFKTEMTELGYVEGVNIVYDVQKTDFDLEAYRRILHRFVEDQVDLILVYPTEAAIEAKTETQGTEIPVVFVFALIEDLDLVQSIREPGGNLTGVRYPGPDIALKRFEILMELLPNAKTLFVPYQKGYHSVTSQLAELEPAAKAAGVTLIKAPADSAKEIETMLAASQSQKIDGILLLAEPIGVTPDVEKVLCKYSYENNVPVGGALFTVEDCGSIFGINVDPLEAGKQSAHLADRILQGASPMEIPVISSESFLQFNNKAAGTLKIRIPEGLLKQADEVIQ